MDEEKKALISEAAAEEQARYESNSKKRKKKHEITEKRRAFPRKKPYIIALLLTAVAAIAFLFMLIVADILPPDLTILLALVVVGLLMLTCFMFASRYRWKRIVGILIAFVAVAVMVMVTSYLNSTVSAFNRISGGGLDATGPAAKSVDVTQEPFNVYITGIDQWASEKGLDLERSDVNMIVTVNPATKQMLLTSIPRDSYVKLHTAQEMDKLTHTGIYGVDETLNTVEDWFGIDLNYYEELYKKAKETNADIVKCKRKNIFEDGTKILSRLNDRVKKNKYNFTYEWTTAIYKTQLIKENNIIFPEECTKAQDVVFLNRVILKANSVECIDNVCYYYFKRENSLDSKKIPIKSVKSALAKYWGNRI